MVNPQGSVIRMAKKDLIKRQIIRKTVIGNQLRVGGNKKAAAMLTELTKGLDEVQARADQLLVRLAKNAH